MMINTSLSKKQEAIEHLGADDFLAAMGTLDGIIDTVFAVHPLMPLISLLKNHEKLVMVGAPEKPLELPVFPLLMRGIFRECLDPFDEPECEAIDLFVNATLCIGKGCPHSCVQRAPHAFSFSSIGTAHAISQVYRILCFFEDAFLKLAEFVSMA
ncbi:hypothetical protein IFM89_002483 [Coptis chinensis]|uniref:Uncharacterized protein n=1 Tax=Coptis chinensis TaxID=261450 RepID=A0A835LM44_9MAGN|nr:hypothetical protein IFM89_002483 [Coptis chinensis]